MPHKRTLLHSLYQNFAFPLAALVLMHAVGTIGYRIIGGAKYSLLDCLYMTFITIATIGIGLVYYMLARMAMFLVAGEINVAMRRRKMFKRIGALTQHYIVCGVGRVGSNVAHELSITDRPYVIVDTVLANIGKHR